MIVTLTSEALRVLINRAFHGAPPFHLVFYLGWFRPPVEQVGASQHAKFARGFEPRTTFSSRQVATPLPNFLRELGGALEPKDSPKESRDALVTHSSTFPHATRIVFRAFDRSPSELGDSVGLI
jgi:hypothetical protein